MVTRVHSGPEPEGVNCECLPLRSSGRWEGLTECFSRINSLAASLYIKTQSQGPAKDTLSLTFQSKPVLQFTFKPLPTRMQIPSD